MNEDDYWEIFSILNYLISNIKVRIYQLFCEKWKLLALSCIKLWWRYIYLISWHDAGHSTKYLSQYESAGEIFIYIMPLEDNSLTCWLLTATGYCPNCDENNMLIITNSIPAIHYYYHHLLVIIEKLFRYLPALCFLHHSEYW